MEREAILQQNPNPFAEKILIGAQNTVDQIHNLVDHAKKEASIFAMQVAQRLDAFASVLPDAGTLTSRLLTSRVDTLDMSRYALPQEAINLPSVLENYARIEKLQSKIAFIEAKHPREHTAKFAALQRDKAALSRLKNIRESFGKRVLAVENTPVRSSPFNHIVEVGIRADAKESFLGKLPRPVRVAVRAGMLASALLGIGAKVVHAQEGVPTQGTSYITMQSNGRTDYPACEVGLTAEAIKRPDQYSKVTPRYIAQEFARLEYISPEQVADFASRIASDSDAYRFFQFDSNINNIDAPWVDSMFGNHILKILLEGASCSGQTGTDGSNPIQASGLTENQLSSSTPTPPDSFPPQPLTTPIPPNTPMGVEGGSGGSGDGGWVTTTPTPDGGSSGGDGWYWGAGILGIVAAGAGWFFFGRRPTAITTVISDEKVEKDDGLPRLSGPPGQRVVSHVVRENRSIARAIAKYLDEKRARREVIEKAKKEERNLRAANNNLPPFLNDRRKGN